MQWLTNKSRRQQIECACYIDFGLKAKACCENFSAHPFFALPDRAPSAFLCASAFTGSEILFETLRREERRDFSSMAIQYKTPIRNS
jgi:hypothetical protein